MERNGVRVSRKNGSIARRQGTRISPPGKVTPFPSPTRKAKTRTDFRARPYPVLIPESEYLVSCIQVFGPHSSRAYGEKIYLTFEIIDGEHTGKKLPMYLRPSCFPTSRLYRFWVIANNGLPSRNATLSPRIFYGKIFRISTATVKPTYGSGAPLPPVFWYSRVLDILSLESTGFVTEISSKSLSDSAMTTGRVGGGRLEAGDEREVRDSRKCQRDGSSANTTNQGGGSGNGSAAPIPVQRQSIAPAPLTPARSRTENSPCGKKHFERAIYRKKLFQLYDNLPPSLDQTKRVGHMIEKAASELFMNRGRELESVNEKSVVESAQHRVSGFSNFEAIKDFEARKRAVVACVVNAVVEIALARMDSK